MSNTPIYEKLNKALKVEEGSGWHFTWGHFEESEFIEHEAGKELPPLFSYNTVLIFTRLPQKTGPPSEAAKAAAMPSAKPAPSAVDQGAKAMAAPAESKLIKEKPEERIPGRRAKFNDQDAILESCDSVTGKTWERYEYYESGALKSVTLYNPTAGNHVKLLFDRLIIPQADNVVRIDVENDKGGFINIGYFTWEIADEAITQRNIVLHDETDRLQGAGKTVKRWLALKAAREDKNLNISMTYSPVAAHIDSQLYDYRTLDLTEGCWREESTENQRIKGVTAETIDDILSNKRLEGSEYPRSEALYWEGKIDPVRVIALQNAEEGKRLRKETTAVAKPARGEIADRWNGKAIPGREVDENVIPPIINKLFNAAEKLKKRVIIYGGVARNFCVSQNHRLKLTYCSDLDMVILIIG